LLFAFALAFGFGLPLAFTFVFGFALLFGAAFAPLSAEAAAPRRGRFGTQASGSGTPPAITEPTTTISGSVTRAPHLVQTPPSSSLPMTAPHSACVAPEGRGRIVLQSGYALLTSEGGSLENTLFMEYCYVLDFDEKNFYFSHNNITRCCSIYDTLRMSEIPEVEED
jgi:hypothetical protein